MRLLLVVGVVLLLTCASCVPSQAAGEKEYYVAPAGSDQGQGSLASPWRTLAYALNRLSPGDTLSLRGGSYFERNVRVALRGTASKPITIRSYPGERAIVDGAVPEFASSPNDEWQVVDPAIELYRSRRTFTGDFAGAWLLADDMQIVQYDSLRNLSSTNYGRLDGMSHYYMGPGLLLHSDRHVYIRLQPNPTDLFDQAGRPIAPVPANTDPNRNAIGLFLAPRLLLLDGAAHVRFEALTLRHARHIIDARDGSQQIALIDSRIDYGTNGITLRAGARDWLIQGCEFNNGLPFYVYWTDVKNKDAEVAEAFPEFLSFALRGTAPGFRIVGNLFRNTFDALRLEAGTSDATVLRNTFQNTRDDAMSLEKGISDVEVAYNLLWRVGSGIANLSSGGKAGPVYIHHNIIDNSAYQRGGRPGNYRAENWPVWTAISPFASHDEGDKAAAWKLYNNTIVTRRSGYPRSSAGPHTVDGNPQKYVYNNIFYIIGDRIIFRDDSAASGSHYDGNLFYRSRPSTLPLFQNFGDGGEYRSLAEFRAKSGTPWELSGLELDPGFREADLERAGADAATIWNRYRPTSCAVATLGASYRGLGWPGTHGVGYRGAVAPALSPLCTAH